MAGRSLASGSRGLSRAAILRAALIVLAVVGLAPCAGAQTANSTLTIDPVFSVTPITGVEPAPVSDAHYLPPPDAWAAPALHTTLFTSFAVLQTLDVATTLRGIGLGRASEANPLMGGLAQHPAALVGVKAGLTAATIMSMRSMSKTHPKAAMITMLALNAGSALVVRSNFRMVMGR